MEKILLVCVIILIVFLLIKVRIVIKKDLKEKTNIDLYIMPRLNIRIDVDKLLSKYKNNTLINIIYAFKKDLKFIFTNKNLFLDFLKYSIIRKIKLHIYYNYLEIPNIYLYETGWLFLSFIKNYLDNHTKKVKKEDYNIIINTDKFGVLYQIDLIIPLYVLIFVGAKNIKNIYKGLKEYGTSN